MRVIYIPPYAPKCVPPVFAHIPSHENFSKNTSVAKIYATINIIEGGVNCSWHHQLKRKEKEREKVKKKTDKRKVPKEN